MLDCLYIYMSVNAGLPNPHILRAMGSRADRLGLVVACVAEMVFTAQLFVHLDDEEGFYSKHIVLAICGLCSSTLMLAIFARNIALQLQRDNPEAVPLLGVRVQ